MTDKAAEMVGIIAAAGAGTRLYPETKSRSKVLLTVDGVSLLMRNILLMNCEMGIREIFIITGDNTAEVEKEIRTACPKDVNITLIRHNDPAEGLAEGVLLAQPYIRGPFCLMLGDELYHASTLSGLVSTDHGDYTCVCAVKQAANPFEIRKNYALEIEDGTVVSVMEKPDKVMNGFLGCGTLLFMPEVFDFIREMPVSHRTGKKELIDGVSAMISGGKTVRPFFFTGGYVNVNTADDLNQACYMVRSSKFHEKTVSLVIPAFNEEDSIGHVIDDFKGLVHEIIVADNRSSDRTAEIAAEKGAKVHSADLKGYGHALRWGMEKATGDILVLTEADGSFKSRDLGKLLEYLKDADMVLGTRTTKQMIQQGANMNLFLRVGNVAVAKIIEILWWSRNEPRLTDVGCTFRAIWSDAYRRISGGLSADGPSFSPEMIIEPIRHGLRIIEIPVSYHGRIGGESKHSGNVKASLKTGFSMLALILKKKIRYTVTDDLVPLIKGLWTRK